jgi:hypothetical protein
MKRDLRNGFPMCPPFASPRRMEPKVREHLFAAVRILPSPELVSGQKRTRTGE